MRRAPRTVLGLVLVTLCVGRSPRAMAQTEDLPSQADRDQAHALYREGRALAESGQYERALELFEEGHRLSHLPGFLFNIGQAHRLAGHCTEAVRAYREFVAADPNADERPEAELHLASLGACPSPAQAAPARTLIAEKKESPAVPASPVLPPRPPSGRGKRIAGLATVTGGIVLTAAALYAGHRAQDASQRVDAVYAENNPTWGPDMADVEAEGQAWNTLTMALGGAAGTALLAGVVLYYFGWDGRF